MGLTIQALKSLKPYLKGSILSLGYQDIVATQDQIQTLFGVWVEKTTDHGKWHQVDYRLPETECFFSAIGCQHICVDIAQIRGTEVICDLNYPSWSKALAPKVYDLVIDGGTLEHCFNIGQALMTVANTVRVGGHIFHWNPLSMVNHGFYNLNPTLYHDFYTQNGWEIVTMLAVSRDNQASAVHPTSRFGAAPELSNLVIAKRLSDQEWKYPTQTKYLRHPTL